MAKSTDQCSTCFDLPKKRMLFKCGKMLQATHSKVKFLTWIFKRKFVEISTLIKTKNKINKKHNWCISLTTFSKYKFGAFTSWLHLLCANSAMSHFLRNVSFCNN